MTKLTGDKTVSRETATEYRGRPLCFEAHRHFLVIGMKGKQTRFRVHYDAIFDLAQKLGFEVRKEGKNDDSGAGETEVKA